MLKKIEKFSSIQTNKIVKTFDKDVITQSNTAFNLGTRLIVFNGRRTRRTRSDLIVLRFFPAPFSLNEQILFCFVSLTFVFSRKTKSDQCTNNDERV